MKNYTTDNLIMKLSEVILYQKTKDSDHLAVVEAIGMENYLKLAKIFENKTKKFKKFEDVYDSIIVATLYYYRKVYINPITYKQGLSYKQIQERFPKEVDVNSYRLKLSRTSDYINNMMFDLINSVEVKDER